jgi:5-hydroxyisourate hydrolase
MITTHVLDTARGGPAVGMTVILQIRQSAEWAPVGRGATDTDGRFIAFGDERPLETGVYRMIFDAGDYHRSHGVAVPFFPEVVVTFSVHDADVHYHVPLLLSPYGYSTYRGT